MSAPYDSQKAEDGPPSLLAPDEPRPFELINPDGAAQVLLT